MTKHLRLIGCLLLASLFSSLAAYGQTDTASIVGTVVDASGAALPNAVVTLVNLGTNLTHTQQGGFASTIVLLVIGLIGRSFVRGGGRPAA